jgi:dipeptidyl aminopeptidase/acylaminoacyl peptidase
VNVVRCLIVGLAAAVSVALPVRAADALVPVSAFVQESVFQRPSLSPDGQLLAVIVNAQQGDRELPTLSVFEVPALKLVTRVKMPFLEVPIEHYWVGNRRLLVSNGYEVGRREAPVATGNIFATDIDGNNQKHLYGPGRSVRGLNIGRLRDSGYGQVHNLPQLANGRFYLNEWRREGGVEKSLLYEIDSLTGARIELAMLPMPDLGFVLQHDGRPRYAFGTDENNLPVLFSREADAQAWSALPLGDSKELLVPLAFTPDEQGVFAALSTAGGPQTLVRETPGASQRVALAQHELGSIDIVMWGPSPAQPFAAATSVGVPALRYLGDDKPEVKLHRALAAQFPGSFVRFLSFSANGDRLLFSVSSDRDPGAFYLFDRTAMKAHLLFDLMSGIDPGRMGERRPIVFKSHDGLELHGYLTVPAGREPRGLPLVLLPHGGPHGVADDWFFDADAQFLASRGYAVLQVNYRGSAGRGAAFRSSGYKEWGGKIQDDLVDAIQWAGHSAGVDLKRVCAYGASFGAFSALLLAAREPAMLKCAVGFAGLYDLPMWFNSDDLINNEKGKRLLTAYIGADPKEQARISPTQLADRIAVPVLLVHGEEDRITPIAQGKAMRKALSQAGKPVEWMEVAAEGHGFYARKNQEAFYRRLESFLGRHLRE